MVIPVIGAKTWASIKTCASTPPSPATMMTTNLLAEAQTGLSRTLSLSERKKMSAKDAYFEALAANIVARDVLYKKADKYIDPSGRVRRFKEPLWIEAVEEYAISCRKRSRAFEAYQKEMGK